MTRGLCAGLEHRPCCPCAHTPAQAAHPGGRPQGRGLPGHYAAGIFYFWKGERPRHANAPQLEGTGELRVETADRATGYWTTRSDRDPGLNARTSGVYLRAAPSDLQVLDSGSEEARAQLIAQRLREWKSAANAF